MFNGKIHYKWPFSIATLNYQRVASGLYITTPSGLSLLSLLVPLRTGVIKCYKPLTIRGMNHQVEEKKTLMLLVAHLSIMRSQSC